MSLAAPAFDDALAAHKQRRRMLRWSAVYLAIVSIGSLLLVAYFLSGFQAYQRVQSTKIGGTPMSYYTLTRLMRDTELRDEQMDRFHAEIVDLEARMAKNANTTRGHRQLAERLENKQDGLIDKIRKETKNDSLSGLEGNYTRKRERVVTILGSVEPVPASVKAFRDQNQSTEFDGLQSAIRLMESENKQLESRVKGLQDKKQLLNDERASFGDEVAPAERKKVMDLIDELRQTATLSNLMLGLPEEMMIVLIVICGGLLGSAVFLTYDYADDTPPRTMAYLSLRLLVGALTSLLLFIVIKAGVIVAIDAPAVRGNQAELNPFFVAFIGVVGGLISHQVVAKIMTSANSWFQDAGGDKPRYLLPAAVAELQDDARRSDFLRLSGFRPDAIERWTTGGGLVPPSGQFALAVYLRREVRDLVSDIPPRMTDPTIAPPQAGPPPPEPAATNAQPAAGEEGDPTPEGAGQSLDKAND